MLLYPIFTVNDRQHSKNTCPMIKSTGSWSTIAGFHWHKHGPNTTAWRHPAADISRTAICLALTKHTKAQKQVIALRIIHLPQTSAKVYARNSYLIKCCNIQRRKQIAAWRTAAEPNNIFTALHERLNTHCNCLNFTRNTSAQPKVTVHVWCVGRLKTKTQQSTRCCRLQS
jgi:hypothetical protein